ncbi:MAG: hypothetical protein SchgKO_21210 [Schleiferiaceae bacterium]
MKALSNIFYVAVFSLFTVFTACNSQTEGESNSDQTAETEANLETDEKSEVTLEELRAIDAELMQSKELDPEFGTLAMGKFIKYVRANPQDTLNPLFTYKAAHIARNVPGKGLKAIQYFTEVYETYPNHELAPEAMLMAGMVWDENYNDPDRAIQYFQKVIETYPDHYTAINAQHLIEMRKKEETDLDWVHKQQAKDKPSE